MGWSVFTDYAAKGELHVKELVLHAIDLLIGREKAIAVQGLPDRGIVTLTHQPGRDIAHLLFAHTSVRGNGIEVIEDAVPLADIHLSIRRANAPKKAYLVPQMEELPFEYRQGHVELTVPRMVLHQMVVLED